MEELIFVRKRTFGRLVVLLSVRLEAARMAAETAEEVAAIEFRITNLNAALFPDVVDRFRDDAIDAALEFLSNKRLEEI